MRHAILIAAGLSMLLGASPVAAQYYDYPPRMYYPDPYGYYRYPYSYEPPPYAAPPRPHWRPRVIYAPPPRWRPSRPIHRVRSLHRRMRAAPHGLVNPLLGPLPGR